MGKGACFASFVFQSQNFPQILEIFAWTCVCVFMRFRNSAVGWSISFPPQPLPLPPPTVSHDTQIKDSLFFLLFLSIQVFCLIDGLISQIGGLIIKIGRIINLIDGLFIIIVGQISLIGGLISIIGGLTSLISGLIGGFIIVIGGLISVICVKIILVGCLISVINGKSIIIGCLISIISIKISSFVQSVHYAEVPL